jgi:hypothetical protein
MADSFAASLAPATKASNMRRALFPNTSDTTLASLTVVFSKIL